MRIRNKRDFWAGVMFMAFGLIFAVLSMQYQVGSAAKMGPGYFPLVLGGILTVLGALIAFSALGKSAHEAELSPIGWREGILVLGAVALFAFALPRLGLVASVILLTFVSALGSHEFRLKETAISAVVLVVMSYLVFAKGLELQFPIWPKFLTAN